MMVPAFNIYNQEKLLGALAGVRAQVRVRVGVEVRVVVALRSGIVTRGEMGGTAWVANVISRSGPHVVGSIHFGKMN